MLDDVYPIRIVNEGVKAVSGGVLYLVFPFYPFLQYRVGSYPFGYVLKAVYQLFVGIPEPPDGRMVGRIQVCSGIMMFRFSTVL